MKRKPRVKWFTAATKWSRYKAWEEALDKSTRSRKKKSLGEKVAAKTVNYKLNKAKEQMKHL